MLTMLCAKTSCENRRGISIRALMVFYWDDDETFRWARFVSRLMARIDVLNLNVSVKDGGMVNVRFRSWNIVSFEFETMRASFELL